MDPVILIILGVVLVIVLILFVLRNKSTEQIPRNDYVPKALYDTILVQNEMLQQSLKSKEMEIRDAYAQVAAKEQSIAHLEDRLIDQKAAAENLQQRFKIEFENIANRLLEEKSQRFTEQNARQLQSVLSPLREKIQEFEVNIDRKFLEETREKTSLRKELEQLRDLNLQLSSDANNLSAALKGQSKVQGDWGEYQLEMLLEKSGLSKGIHFITQASYKDDNGAAKRPDFVVQLPDNKQLIIDSKVSLTAFERYFNDPDPASKEKHLKAHIDSIRAHVDNLSSKNYQLLYQINSPDYLLLFIPLESALSTATQADGKLFTDALERNIILVSTGSLLATMRTVSHLWKQEKQTRSVMEIARQSGLLYDKFVSFVEDLRAIGLRLDGARDAYDAAMHKLTNASRPGDTLIGKAEKIRELGAKTSKTLPVTDESV